MYADRIKDFKREEDGPLKDNRLAALRL